MLDLGERFGRDLNAQESANRQIKGVPSRSPIWDYRPFVGDEHRHMRTFDVRRAAGAAASRGADNITGHTGEIATNKRRTRSEFP